MTLKLKLQFPLPGTLLPNGSGAPVVGFNAAYKACADAHWSVDGQ